MSKFAMTFLPLVMSFLLTSTSFGAKKAPVKKKKSVFVKTLKSEELFDLYSFPAKVVPKINATVTSEFQGIVRQIQKGLGTNVKKGEVILKVKHTDPVFRYRPQFLVSPVDGVVSKVFVSVGALVNKGQMLVTVTDPENVKVMLEVSNKNLPYINRGDEGVMSLRDDTREYPVEITGISPYVDPATGTATVELHFSKNLKKKNSSHLQQWPRIGTLGRVKFKSNEHTGIRVPEHAIFYEGKKTYLRVLSDKNMIHHNEVVLGPKRRGMVEIKKGAKEGLVIIEKASGFIAEGAEVIVKNDPRAKKESAAKDKE